MKTKRIIKFFTFTEDKRSLLTIGTDTRLNPETHRLQLKEDDNGQYSIADNLNIKTWVTDPNTVKQWIGFEAVVRQKRNINYEIVTETNFRLGNGTDEYYWNGSTWEVNDTDWNTEKEIADNISSFPVAAKKIQVVINLKTTDKNYTPEVEEVKVLYSSDIEFLEDLIYRSFLPTLREELKPIGDYAIDLEAATSTIDLDTTYPLETPYNLIDIDSCFNDTDDPEHLTDIFQSYDLNTKVITLTGSVAQGKRVWIRFVYVPEIMVTTSQEYSEVDKVPAVALTDINENVGFKTGIIDAVTNKDEGTAVQVVVHQTDVEVVLRIMTDKDKDQKRIADELEEFFANNLFLRSRGLDEKYALLQTSGYDQRNVITQKELHSGFLRCIIEKALFYKEQSKDVYAIKRLKLLGRI